MSETKILITGASGQIGKALTLTLREQYGTHNVLASDIHKDANDQDPYEFLDILNPMRLEEIITDYGITQIYHLAAILSASGEKNPSKTWNINFNGLMTILELADKHKLDRVFFPSTIAVFGNTTPRDNTPQDVPLLPTTVYGMSKTAGELWCNYYHATYGVDVRCIRYPGIIGYRSIPHGGTTDYAVEIFHEAVKNQNYECFLRGNTRLPMMYIDDAIRATIEIMQAPKEDINLRYGYNLSAVDFTPEEIASEIRKAIPEFEMTYKPDFRQAIADSWTSSIDDSAARSDWGWNHHFDLSKISEDMINRLKIKYNV